MDRLTSEERLALVTLQTARDALMVAIEACRLAGFGGVHVLGPLEQIRADLAKVSAVVEGKA
jgi:hypothetical protein